MQGLTADPRQDLTNEESRELLTGNVDVKGGLELLHPDGTVDEDLTDWLGEDVPKLTHKGYADIHGTCSFTLHRPLMWGRDLIRFYQVRSNRAGLSGRYNTGTYVPIYAPTEIGETPSSFAIEGLDPLFFLQDPAGDTHVADEGETYLSRIRAAIAAAGSEAGVLLDGNLIDTELPAPMVWAVTDQGSTQWLRIVNDMLEAINYRGLWVDENGSYRSEPYQNPFTTQPSWTFHTGPGQQTVISPSRTVTQDLYDAPNWWRFVRRNHPTTPVDGNGRYTFENLSAGPSSRSAIGRKRPKGPVFLDAADQDALEAAGNRTINEDMAVTKVIRLQVDALPIVQHLDVVEVINEDDTKDRAVVVESTTNQDGSKGEWVLEVIA